MDQSRGEEAATRGRAARLRRGAALFLTLWGALVLGTGWMSPSDRPGQAGPDDSDVVLLTRVDDPITPVIADHVSDMVDEAEHGGYHALLVEMDTPGGLDTSMRDIVQRFLAAEVPVIVYVNPSGARAASAGAFISWSAHIVAMAPGTTIGAATPVQLEGGEVGDKVVNDAAAYARAVAEERGRNIEVAAEAVTEGRALSASEAVDEDVADLIASDRQSLFDDLDGTRVELPGGTTVALRTADAPVEERDLSLLRTLLQWLANPNLAFLFMSVGTLGLIYELASPGLGFAGGIGIVLILMGLFALSILPIDAVGLVFLFLAAALFVAELFAPGIGIAAGLGSVSLVLSGLFLFRDDAPGLSLSLAAVVPTAVVIGVAVVIAGRLAWRARQAPSSSGTSGFVGREVKVARATDKSAQAWLEGAWWSLRSEHRLATGQRVRVLDVDGLDLVVEPVEDAPADAVEVVENKGRTQ